MAAITGMLILGKMSIGMRRIVNTPSSSISSASTMKVWGRWSATCTIRMEVSPLLFTNGRYLRIARYRLHFRVRARAFHLKRHRVSRRRSPSIITGETRGDPREIARKTTAATLTASVKLRAATPEAEWVPATGQVERMSGIAIYEENDLMRALLREWLSEAGYRVRAESLCGLQIGGMEDLVIASVYMPKQAG